MQTPEYRICQPAEQLDNTPTSLQPVAPTARRFRTLLGNVATRAARRRVQSVYNHSNIQPVYDVYASVQDRDLGSAAAGDPVGCVKETSSRS